MNSYNLIKPYFKRHKTEIAVGLISLIMVDIFQLYIPRVVKKAIDSLTIYNTDFTELLWFGATIAALGIFIAVLRYIWRRCLIGLSRYIERELRDKLFLHIQTLSPSFFSKTRTGDLMAHATNDLNHIRMATGMGLVALTDGIFLGTSSIAFMVYINPRLALYALIPMPFIFLTALLMSKKMHKSYQETQAVFSILTEKIREFFSGIRIVKSYQLKNFAYSDVEEVSKDYVKKNLILTAMTGALFPLMVMISNISTGIVLLVGGKYTIMNIISTGDFVAFISYLGLLVWPMMAVGWVTNLIQRGRASLDRLNIIFKTKPEILDKKDAVGIASFDNSLKFSDIVFEYPHQNFSTLSNVSLEIVPGKITGIAGPPGSGKTTLLKMIPRLFDPHEGYVKIGNKDITDYTLSSYRNLFSYMEQEPFMFSGSVKENITFGANIDNIELNTILKKASLLETVNNLPNGIDTIIGEKGIILSGGQKQRVAFARALLKKNCVYLLDDPVSQVDTKTSSNIIDTIYSLETVVLTSHRFRALINADIIYVIENGKVTAKGTHEELLINCPYYSGSYKMQSFLEEN